MIYKSLLKGKKFFFLNVLTEEIKCKLPDVMKLLMMKRLHTVKEVV